MLSLQAAGTLPLVIDTEDEGCHACGCHVARSALSV